MFGRGDAPITEELVEQLPAREKSTIEAAAIQNGLNAEDARELAQILESSDERYRPMLTEMFYATLALQRARETQEEGAAYVSTTDSAHARQELFFVPAAENAPPHARSSRLGTSPEDVGRQSRRRVIIFTG